MGFNSVFKGLVITYGAVSGWFLFKLCVD
jgi:hypothetical protein